MSTRFNNRIDCVAISGSAGAVEALVQILPQLKASVPFSVVCVLHMSPESSNLMIPIFREKCQLRVAEVESGTVLEPGVIYFCPPDYHLSIEKNRTVSLSLEPPVRFSRPSLDIFLNSAAEAYQDRILGILLSGANDDGARGLAYIQELGGMILIQDPEEATHSTMPQAALKLCRPDYVLGTVEITQFLNHLALTSLRGSNPNSELRNSRGGTFEQNI